MRDFESGAPPGHGRPAAVGSPRHLSRFARASTRLSRIPHLARCGFIAPRPAWEPARLARGPSREWLLSRERSGLSTASTTSGLRPPNQEPDLVWEESETPRPACADRGPRPPRRARFRSDRVRGLLDDVGHRGDADLEGRVVESTERNAARGMPLSPRNAPVEPDEVPAGTERKPVEIKSGATSGDAHYLGRCSYREARPHYHPTPPAPARRAPGGRARPGRAGLPDPCIIFRRRAGRLRRSCRGS